LASRSVPTIGTRVNVQLFAGDLLAHQNLIMVESYTDLEAVSAVFSDGAGVKVSLTGDRSSLRMILSAALAGILPEVAPEPPEEQSS
jgi:hypothetical protein